MWTQTIFRVKNQFQNPLHQNYKHTRTLEGLLGLPKDSVKSVIAFVGDCELKSNFPDNVCKGSSCFGYVKSFKEEIYTVEKIEQILASIEELRLSRSLKTHLNHVKHVKTIVEEKKLTVTSSVEVDSEKLTEISDSKDCPKCGSELVERTVKKGKNMGNKFLGCSTFPKCRHMEKL